MDWVMVKIEEEALRNMTEHAAAEYPRECCGILVGRAESEKVAVTRAIAARNVAEAERLRDRYVVEPLAIVRAERETIKAGMAVVGFYHSHPDHPAQPSETDVKLAWDGYVYLIIAVGRDGVREMRAWRFAETGPGEIPLTSD